MGARPWRWGSSRGRASAAAPPPPGRRAGEAARRAVARPVAVGGPGLGPPDLELLTIHGEVAVEGLGGLLRTRAHEEGDEGAPALAQHLDLAQLAVAVELVAQVRLGDLRREAAHPQRGDPLVLGRRELGLLPGPVQVLLGE